MDVFDRAESRSPPGFRRSQSRLELFGADGSARWLELRLGLEAVVRLDRGCVSALGNDLVTTVGVGFGAGSCVGGIVVVGILGSSWDAGCWAN